MPPTQPSETATRILEAVMQLILAGGLPAVTLSAVCRKAGLSKGGLMHHFPSKESMVDAFLEHCVGEYLSSIQQAADLAAVGPGKRTTAILDLFLGASSASGSESDRYCAAVMMAFVQGGGHPSLVQEVDRTLLRVMRDDGLSADSSELILATLDGVWLQSVIAAPETMGPRIERIRKKLNQLIESEVSMVSPAKLSPVNARAR
ncbi:MAG: TetR/AcrR family transcriptional regulator [Novipirellula sp. JB048]